MRGPFAPSPYTNSASSRASVEITLTLRAFKVAMKSSGISWSRTLCTRMLTPWSTMRRASASSTICAMVILPCLRAWSITAAVNSGVSLG